MSVTVGQYRSTVAFTTTSKLPDSISTHAHLLSCWQISGPIKAKVITGNWTDSEWLFSHIRVGSSIRFIKYDTDSTSVAWYHAVGCQFVNCRGAGVNVYDSVKAQNFHIYSITNRRFSKYYIVIK